MEYQHIVHPFEPLYSRTSKLLILGSFPSVKSREQNFFYGHPQNRFWKVVSQILEEPLPTTIEEKRNMLLKHDIAVWDVIYSCDIKGSSDSSIRNVVPTDLAVVLNQSQITKVYCNGQTSGKMYEKYQEKRLGISAVTLPSTSPANAAFSVERLMEEWKQIIEKDL